MIFNMLPKFFYLSRKRHNHANGALIDQTF